MMQKRKAKLGRLRGWELVSERRRYQVTWQSAPPTAGTSGSRISAAVPGRDCRSLHLPSVGGLQVSGRTPSDCETGVRCEADDSWQRLHTSAEATGGCRCSEGGCRSFSDLSVYLIRGKCPQYSYIINLFNTILKNIHFFYSTRIRQEKPHNILSTWSLYNSNIYIFNKRNQIIQSCEISILPWAQVDITRFCSCCLGEVNHPDVRLALIIDEE